MPSVRMINGLGVIEAARHPSINDVEQYRGIPYGIIPARFRQAKLVTSWQDGIMDGSQYGPVCPYPRFVLGGSIVQKPLKAEHEHVMDEFHCLNLNVTCPARKSPTEGWPVVVWIHGGANVMGCGSEAQYDAAPLVSRSILRKQPVVMVTVNYRVGILGFLASLAIKQDNEAAGDNGVGNYGIHDQLLAFEWVKKYIQAFGGDRTRVTAMGESAGSIDTHIIMLSNLFTSARPFSQAILQSGVAPLTVRSLKHQEMLYTKVSKHLQARGLEALRNLSPVELFTSYATLGSPLPSWQATVDGYLLSTLPRFSELASYTYHPSFQRLLIGDCADEGILWIERLQELNWTPSDILQTAQEIAGAEDAKAIMEEYKISADMPQEKLILQLLKFLTDSEWGQPIEAVARSFTNGEVYYYYIKEGNPFDGSKKGIAHHGVDLLYPFLTYIPHLPAQLVKLSYTICDQWVTFINGGRPWAPYSQTKSGNDTLMMFGPAGSSKELPEKLKESYKALRVCERYQDSSSMIAARVRGDFIMYDSSTEKDTIGVDYKVKGINKRS